MNILLVTTSYPRNSADLSGIFVKRLAVAMVKTGAKVTVLAPGDREVNKFRSTEDGIRVFRFIYAPRPLMRIGYGNGGIPENLRRWPWLFAVLPLFVISMVLHAIYLAGNSDIIHANWLATGVFCFPAKKIRKKPLAITLRGSDLRKRSPLLLPFIINKADSVTTVNNRWALDLQKTYHRKIYYTPNGVSVSETPFDPKVKFGIESHEIIVLNVGVLQERKGTDVLFEAAKIAMELNPPVKFLVIGPGDPKEFGLHALPNVICTGGLPPHEVLGVYSYCDIFVLASRFEGRPNVLLEAMAAGIPCVATRLPGVLEVLNDESGILVDIEDPRALADAISVLANDPELRKTMGKRARGKIAALSLHWQSSARKYLHIFETILHQQRYNNTKTQHKIEHL